jgi:hypothetical protein
MENEFKDKTRPEALAFPMSYPSHVMYIHQGLTKREYFAAMAMQNMAKTYRMESADLVAKAAVAYADALIEALNK